MKLAGSILVLTPVLLLAVALLAPAVGLAQRNEVPPKAWDQAEVVRLSGDLQKQMNAIRKAFRSEPVFTTTATMKQRSARQMDEVLRDLERSARQLKSRAEGGAKREDTENIARKIGSLLRDAEMLGRRLDLGEFTNKHIRPAMQTLNELAPFYGAGPLYDVENMEATGLHRESGGSGSSP